MNPCAACLRARRRVILWLGTGILLLPAWAGDPAPTTESPAPEPHSVATVGAPGATTTTITTITTTTAAEPAPSSSASTTPDAVPPASGADSPTVTGSGASTSPPTASPAPAPTVPEPAMIEPPPPQPVAATRVPPSSPSDTTAPVASTAVTSTAPSPLSLDPPGAGDPLVLDATYRLLPDARIERAYRRPFHVTGGQSPYVAYRLFDGTLPAGIALVDSGEIAGTPTTTGRSKFRVEVTDSAGNHALQGYVLHVRAKTRPTPHPRKPTPAPVPESPPPPPTRLDTVPADAGPPPLGGQPTISVYSLTDKTIAMIEATVTEPEPAPEALATAAAGASPADVGAAAGAAAGAVAGAAAGAAAAQVATRDAAAPSPPTASDALPPGMTKAGASKLQQALAPLAGVEFPRRDLFLAALDQRLCDYAQALVQNVADGEQLAAPAPWQWSALCEVAWDNPATTTLTGPIGQVPWQALPTTLMPPSWRDWLAARAEHVEPITLPDTPGWTGTGCNCLTTSTSDFIFGLLPGWHDPAQAAPIDFALYDRLIAFALPFDDNGNLILSPPSQAQLKFVRTTHRYASRIDLAIYRDDWAFLAGLSQEQSDRAAHKLARQAVGLINTPLARLARHWYDRVPGLAPDEYLGDGLALYLEGPTPGSPNYPAFDRFRDELLRGLIKALSASQREVALSVMIDSAELTPGKGDQAPGWPMQRLFDYLVLADDVAPDERSDSLAGEDDRNDARLRLHYLVLMPEPGGPHLRRLRAKVEDTEGLTGESRRAVLRTLQPVVSVGASDEAALLDDLTYVADNFGGVALWPQAQADPAVTGQLQRALKQTLMAELPEENPLCTPVCEWRWPLRAAFFALATLTALGLLAWLVVCRVRRSNRRLVWSLLAGIVLSLTLGIVLLQCDPGLAEVREGNTLLFALVAVIVIGLLVALLRPNVEKP